MANTNPPSGTDIASFGISVDSTQPADAAAALDKMAAASVKAGSALDTLNDSASENQKWLSESKRKWMELEEEIRRQAKAVEDAERAEKEYANVQKAAVEASQAFLVKLQELVTTYGLTREEIYRLTAAQLGLSESAEPLIAELEALKAATAQYGKVITDVASIEAARIEFEESAQTAFIAFKRRTLAENAALEESAATALNAQRIRSVNEQIAVEESAQTALNAQRIRVMAENRAAAMKMLEAQEADRIAIQARQEQSATAFQAFKIRTMAENRAEAMRILEEQEAAAAALAEKQAIEEIKWGELSVKTRIAQLERLKEYQANSAISAATIQKTFGSAALADLPNLTKYQKEYTEALEASSAAHGRHSKAAKDGADAAGLFGIQTSRATSEVVVLGRELSRGNYTRMAGSFTILAQAIGLTLNPITALGIAAVGLFYEMAKGAGEQEAMNAALILTGNYAGATADSLYEMAKAGSEVNGTIGVAKEAVTKLAATGKFTSEQIATISTAATEMQHVFGQSIDKTIADFEKLAVQQLDGNVRSTGEVTKAAVKLDDQYHFLTTSILEEIHALEQDGDTKAASKLATDTLAETTRQRAAEMVKNLGYVSSAWNSIKAGISSAIDKINEWGKAATAGSEVTRLTERLKHIDSGDEGNINDKATQNHRVEIVKALAAAQAQLNHETAIGNAQGDVTQKRSAAVHAAAQVMEDDAKLVKKTESNLQLALDRYKEQLKLLRADNEGEVANPLLTEKAIKDHIEKIKKAYAEKPKAAANDGRTAKLLNGLDEATGEYESAKRAVDGNAKLLAEALHSGSIESKAYYDSMRQGAKDELTALQSSYNEKIALLEHYKARNKVDAEETKKRITDTTNWFMREKDRIENAGGLLDMKQKDQEKKYIEDLVKNVTKIGDTEVESLQKRIDAQKQYNFEVGKSAQAKLAAKQAAEALQIAQNESDASLLQNVVADKDLSKEAVAVYTTRLVWLNQVISKQKELAGLQKIGQDEDTKLLDAKNISKSLDDALKSAHKFETGMKAAFGNVGKSIGEMVVALADYNKKNDEIEKNKKKWMEAAGDDPVKKANAEAQANKENGDNQIAMYATMADSAKGFFSAQSDGYKMMDGISKVAHAVQVAMMLKEMTLLATKAVMTQAGGDPYSAWARMAAMAAVVATLGFAVGGGFNSTGDSGMTKEAMQKANGTGTVFGDSSAKSESIMKSIDLLAKNSNETMPISESMLKSLRGIESAMAGLVNVILRSYGLASGNGLGLYTGTTRSLGGLWGKSTTSIEDSGLHFDPNTTVGQYAQGMGIDQYATAKTESSSWFGLKHDTSYNRQFGSVGNDVSSQIGKIFEGVADSLSGAAKAFGMDAQKTNDYIKSLNFTEGFISLRGLTGQALQDALNAGISAMTDQIAAIVFPGLQAFQKAGEGYLETTVRVAHGVDEANSALGSLGVSAINFNDIVNKQGDVTAEIVRQSIVNFDRFDSSLGSVDSIMQDVQGTAEELVKTYKVLLETHRLLIDTGLNGNNLTSATITGAGGLSELNSGLKTFLDKYFTPAEKAAAAMASFGDQIHRLGIYDVPQTRDQFKQLVQSVDTSTASGQQLQGQLLALAGTFDNAVTATDDLKNAWQSLTDSLMQEVDRLRNAIGQSSGSSFAKAQSDFALATAQARAGDQTAAGKLTGLSQALETLAEAQATSLTELQLIRANTANSLEATAKIYKDQYGVKIPGFASGGDFGGGMRMVGEHGAELELTGPSRIFSATQTSAILSGNGLKGELQALRMELSYLRSENRAAQEAIARNTEKMQKVLTRNDTSNGLLITNTLPT